MEPKRDLIELKLVGQKKALGNNSTVDSLTNNPYLQSLLLRIAFRKMHQILPLKL